MEYVYLSGTDIHVPRLCIGGCPMGMHGWGDVSRKELIDSIHAALNAGLNFFDTADIYGIGEAERILGYALQGKRNKAVINSKFGVRRSPGGESYYDNSSQWMQIALDASLKRLRTDYIDMYHVHYRDDETPLEAVVEILEEFKNQGKIRCYGVSNISGKDQKELEIAAGKICSFQNEYSLAKRDYEKEILDFCENFSMTPMTWGSLGQGILTGKYGSKVCFNSDDRRSRSAYVNFHGDKLKHNLRIVDKMRVIAEDHQVSIASVAIRWVLDRIPGSIVIAGVKKPQQLRDNYSALGWQLSPLEMKTLDSVSNS